MRFLKDDYIQSIKTGIIAKVIDANNSNYEIDFMDNIWGKQFYSKEKLEMDWDIAYPESCMTLIKIKCSCGAIKTYGKLSPIRNHSHFCEIHHI